MVNYFDDIEKQKELKKVLDEWLDTPFRHHTGVKGLGCDCIHFAGMAFAELGVLNFNPKIVPDYPRDWHLHNTREILSEAIEKHIKYETIELSDKLLNGDLILSHYGKASSHVGIYYDGYVYQAIDKFGVKKINFNDQRFRKQMKFVYRVIK